MMRKFAATVLTAVLATAPVLAQTASQDAKKAGHETAAATKDTGHAIAKGTEKGYNATKKGTVKAAKATKHGTAVAATKTARGTKSVAKKATGDNSPTTTPHDPPKKN